MGLYDPGTAFSSIGSVWPPLTLVLGRAFTGMKAAYAYQAQLLILISLAAASVVLSADLASRVATDGSNSGEQAKIRTKIMVFMGFWLATSYGLMFELERGNINLYALFFSLLSVWLMVGLPRSAWLPALALAVAVSLKVYPAVLFVPLIWRYRWRAVMPLIVTNLALLLVAGPRNAVLFVRNLSGFQGAPLLWVGNHSAAGFAWTVADSIGLGGSWIVPALLLASFALWAFAVVILMRSGWSERNVVMMSAACVPLMSILPSVSHDYKLTLAVFPLAVMVAVILDSTRRNTFWWGALFSCVALELVMLGRSTLLIAPSMLANKYPLLVMIQVLILIVAWRMARTVEATSAEGRTAREAPLASLVRPE